MEYADVSDVFESGDRYRAVRFSHYRWDRFNNNYSTYQDDNGYEPGYIYWFRYDPIVLRVLDANEGLLMAENLIDSQPFHNVYYNGFGDPSLSHDVSNWKYSSLKKWMNGDFYNTAFNKSEQGFILKQSLQTPSYYDPEHGTGPKTDPTNDDMVYLLSRDDALNESYGFKSDYIGGVDSNRIAYGTDYARCQGLYVDSSTGNYYSGASGWHLRTPYSVVTNCYVYYEGYANASTDPLWTHNGIRPALNVNLQSAISQSIIKKTDSNNLVINGPCGTEEKVSVFNKNSYIADIWLGSGDRAGSPESSLISTILDYTSFSAELYSSGKTQLGVAAWESVKSLFDFNGTLKETVTEKDIYETLIFDMIKKVLSDRQKELTEVVTDAIDVGTKAAGYVTTANGILKKLTDLVPVDGLLDYLKDWKFSPSDTKFQEFVGFLNDIDFVKDSWDSAKVSKFARGIGTVASAASDVSNFYKRVTNFILVQKLAYEMTDMLRTMRGLADYGPFRSALDEVIKAIGNADYAAYAATAKLGRDLGLTVIGCFVDVTTALVPGYALIQTAYKTAVAFDDIMFNTSDVVAAFFAMGATKRFSEVSRKTVRTLAEKYKASGDESDAGAYVYAMQTYKHVYVIDLESALEYVKVACDEGLVNKAQKVKRAALNVLYDLFDVSAEIEGTYDVMLRYKNSLVNSLNAQFDSLLTSWCFNEEYLQKDYPSVYPIYAADFYGRAVFAPNILNAFVTDDGGTRIVWSTDCYYVDSDGISHKINSARLTGVEIRETAGESVTVQNKPFIPMENSAEFHSAGTDTFPRYYFVASYEESGGNKIYTAASSCTVEKPCLKVSLFMGFLSGRTLQIRDDSPVRYRRIRYHIYRKDPGTDQFVEIDVIDRQNKYGGSITLYEDRTAESGKTYSYKVISEYPFANGEKVLSDESGIFTVKIVDAAIGARRLLETIDRRTKTPSGNDQDLLQTTKTNRKLAYKLTENESDAGSADPDDNNAGGAIELVWEKDENADGYQIYRKSGIGTYYRLIGDTKSNVTTYSDTDVNPVLGYCYQVVPYRYDESGSACLDPASSIAGKTEGMTDADMAVGDGEPADPGQDLYAPGDIDGNGQILADDARLALRASAKLEELSEAQLLAADVDGNNQVLADDARQILRFSAKLQQTFDKA